MVAQSIGFENVKHTVFRCIIIYISSSSKLLYHSFGLIFIHLSWETSFELLFFFNFCWFCLLCFLINTSTIPVSHHSTNPKYPTKWWARWRCWSLSPWSLSFSSSSIKASPPKELMVPHEGDEKKFSEVDHMAPRLSETWEFQMVKNLQ